MDDKVAILVFWCCVVGCIFCACIINNMKDIKKHYDNDTTPNTIRVQPVNNNILPERWLKENP